MRWGPGQLIIHPTPKVTSVHIYEYILYILLKIMFLLFMKTNFKLEYQGVIVQHNDVQQHPLHKHMQTYIIYTYKYLHTYTSKHERTNER